MVRILIATVLAAFLTTAAAAQAPAPAPAPAPVIQRNQFIEAITNGSVLGERLCLYAKTYDDYARCRLGYLVIESHVPGRASLSFCRSVDMDEMTNKIRKDFATYRKSWCDPMNRMRWEWTIVEEQMGLKKRPRKRPGS